MSDWIDASKQLPDDDISVLIVQDGEVYMGFHDNDGWHDMEGMPIDRVTHWQHLPAPPQ